MFWFWLEFVPADRTAENLISSQVSHIAKPKPEIGKLDRQKTT
jgi:hypothetical protein